MLSFSFQWHQKTLFSDKVPGSYNAKGHLRAFLTMLTKQRFTKRRMVRPKWPLLPGLRTSPRLITWASLYRGRNKASDDHYKGSMVPTKEHGEKWKHRNVFFHASLLPIPTPRATSSRPRFPWTHWNQRRLAGQPPSFAHYPLVISVTSTRWRNSFCHFESEERNF